jgi:hypothetical protein
MSKQKIILISALAVTIFLGLASRNYGSYLPAFLAKYTGDTLWALMVFLAINIFFPKLTTVKSGIFALLFSYGIEISQLYHAAWIDCIRNTTLGALVFGFGFLWSDLICYTAGITIGLIFRMALLNKSI